MIQQRCFQVSSELSDNSAEASVNAFLAAACPYVLKQKTALASVNKSTIADVLTWNRRMGKNSLESMTAPWLSSCFLTPYSWTMLLRFSLWPTLNTRHGAPVPKSKPLLPTQCASKPSHHMTRIVGLVWVNMPLEWTGTRNNTTTTLVKSGLLLADLSMQVLVHWKRAYDSHSIHTRTVCHVCSRPEHVFCCTMQWHADDAALDHVAHTKPTPSQVMSKGTLGLCTS